MEVTGNVPRFLSDFFASFQMARLYGDRHVKFLAAVDKAFGSLVLIMKEKGEFVIGVVGEELIFEKEIFFEFSRLAVTLVLHIKARGIEKIIFYPSVTRDEVEKFIIFLADISKDEARRDPAEVLKERGINGIFAGKINVPVSSSDKAMKQDMKDVVRYFSAYENYCVQTAEFTDALINEGTIDPLSLKMSMTVIADNAFEWHKDILKLTSVKRHDITTFVHIVNVSVLAMYFSSKLGFSREDVLDIGVAGLFHDIGKIYISKKIIGKEAKLTDFEFAAIKSHTHLGAEILIRSAHNLGELPVLAAFEHHFRYDCKGYPKVPFKYKPHTVSLIVAICDVYDALSQRRSYKAGLSPDTIYQIMMKEKGAGFEPELLENFFKFIGVWPVSTVVVLSDERVAIVREAHEDAIISPTVEIVYPHAEKILIDLREHSDIRIVAALNPFAEGKSYLHLI